MNKYYTEILAFYLDKRKVSENSDRLCDLLKTALFHHDPHLFQRLDFDNDRAFLEPSLFYYFLSGSTDSKRSSLDQSLFGYVRQKDRSWSVFLKPDRFGVINLPNLGYLKSKNGGGETLVWDQIEERLLRDEFVAGSRIRLCLHSTELLEGNHGIKLMESPRESLSGNIASLLKATGFFKNVLPDFWELIESVTREFVVFNSPNYNSFAAISYHGTAYFNSEGKVRTPVFFIEDIAHQCGHILFNVLTLDIESYLNVPKETPLRYYSIDIFETRSVYSAFHGLFTYTTILYSLSILLEEKRVLSGQHEREALARLGFYLHKFKDDLYLMRSNQLLTEEGMLFHKQFSEGYDQIRARYENRISGFCYRNQPYTFQLDLFQAVNPVLSTFRF